MNKITNVRGGPRDPVAPQWVNMQIAHDMIVAVVGPDPAAEWCFRRLMGSGRVAWRAKEGEQSDDGELQALHGLEVDACGLRSFLGTSRYLQ